MTAAIDRLVSGDLDEPARRSVLAWLDEEPARWRQCGLAFLEAQTWSQAMGAWRSAQPAEASTAHEPVRQPLERRRRSAAYAAVLVAGIVLAFGLGFVASGVFRDGPHPGPGGPQLAGDGQNAASREERDTQPPRETPVLAAVGVKSSGWCLPDSVQIPVVPSSAAASSPELERQIPDHVRRQWERRGYEIKSQRRYLFARLPDGEQVAVPIEHISLDPVGTRIY